MVLFKLRELLVTSPARRNKGIMLSFWLSLVLNIIFWIILLIKFFGEQEYIILRYNIYFGISDLGPWYRILILPAMGLLVIAVNLLLAFYFYFKNSLISYFLSFTAVFFNCALIFSGILLIYFNL